MARFKVGDEAKIVKAPKKHWLLGHECTVTEVILGDVNKYVVDIPEFPLPDGKRWLCTGDQLEPKLGPQTDDEWFEEFKREHLSSNPFLEVDMS